MTESQKTWYVLPQLSAPMPLQMAIDELLFRERLDSRFPFLRFYYSSEPWISVGYSTPLEDVAATDLPVCKRITGGGIVKHENDLIFSLGADKSHDESFKSVRTSYWKIHEAVKVGFEKQGVDLTYYRCDEDLPKGSDCFVYPIATDLSYKGAKVAGGSQKRSMGSLLHQESMQIRKGWFSNQMIEWICQGVEEVFSVKLEPIELDPDLLFNAEKLALEKYQAVSQIADVSMT